MQPGFGYYNSGGPSGRIEAYSFVVHAECTRFQRLIMLQHHEVSGGRLQPRAQYRHSKVGTARQIRPQRTPLGLGRKETSATARGCSSALITENVRGRPQSFLYSGHYSTSTSTLLLRLGTCAPASCVRSSARARASPQRSRRTSHRPRNRRLHLEAWGAGRRTGRRRALWAEIVTGRY